MILPILLIKLLFLRKKIYAYVGVHIKMKGIHSAKVTFCSIFHTHSPSTHQQVVTYKHILMYFSLKTLLQLNEILVDKKELLKFILIL